MRDVRGPRLHAVTQQASLRLSYRNISVLMCTQVTLKIRKINIHTLLLHITHVETDLHLHACQHSEVTLTILSQLRGREYSSNRTEQRSTVQGHVLLQMHKLARNQFVFYLFYLIILIQVFSTQTMLYNTIKVCFIILYISISSNQASKQTSFIDFYF